MLILGIETSCDETAVSVVQNGQKLLSSVVASSVDLHKVYGGVVPEIAARSHLEVILPVIDEAITSANTVWESIDAVAVTIGPGLSGSLLIGVLTARTLALAKAKPLFPVNHVEAHVYASFITETGPNLNFQTPKNQPKFPLLALIISGGHTQLVLFHGHFDYKVISYTLDDAVGEAFDKVAKILGLPYPGGPSISEWAKKGDPKSVKLPSAWLNKESKFSYSGLKTAVLRCSQTLVGKDFTFPSTDLSSLLTHGQKQNIAASFQHAAIVSLINALSDTSKKFKPKSIVICGGVAANSYLRELAYTEISPTPIFPDIKLCTDNGAMVAACGYYKALSGLKPSSPYSLEISPNLSMLRS